MLKHVWVVTNLPQLHDCVHQCLSSTFTLQDITQILLIHPSHIHFILSVEQVGESFHHYLLVFLRAISKQDSFSLHVPVQYSL